MPFVPGDSIQNEFTKTSSGTVLSGLQLGPRGSNMGYDPSRRTPELGPCQDLAPSRLPSGLWNTPHSLADVARASGAQNAIFPKSPSISKTSKTSSTLRVVRCDPVDDTAVTMLVRPTRGRRLMSPTLSESQRLSRALPRLIRLVWPVWRGAASWFAVVSKTRCLSPTNSPTR